MVARRRTHELSPREQLDTAPEPYTWDEIAQMWFGMDIDAFEQAYNRGDFDDRLLEPHVFELALRWGLPARSPAQRRQFRRRLTLTPAQLQAIREREARRYFGMSADEFIAAYRAGAFDDDIDRPHLQALRMLFPREP